jgi:hypothetical protein
VRRAFADVPVDVSTIYWDSSFAPSAAIAMRSHAAEVGIASCAYVTKHAIDDGRLTVAYTAIAASKTPCPAITDALHSLCDESIDCDGGVCSQEMLRPEIQQWAEQAMLFNGSKRTFHQPSDVHRSLLAAGWVQGPLPADFTLTNARRNYAIDLGEAGAACWERAEAGVPCVCANAPVQWDLCTMKLDGGRFAAQTCSFFVDDKKKTIADPRHACGAAGAECVTEGDCCIETTCKAADGGIGPSHCR